MRWWVLFSTGLSPHYAPVPAGAAVSRYLYPQTPTDEHRACPSENHPAFRVCGESPLHGNALRARSDLQNVPLSPLRPGERSSEPAQTRRTFLISSSLPQGVKGGLNADQFVPGVFPRPRSRAVTLDTWVDMHVLKKGLSVSLRL